MKKIKKIVFLTAFTVFLLCIHVFFIHVIWHTARSIDSGPLADCNYPLQYTVTNVIPGSGLTDAEFRSAIAEAEQRWEIGLKRDVFVRGESGIAITFIDDGRWNKLELLYQPLLHMQELYVDKLEQYDRLVEDNASFKSQIKAYLKMLASYTDYEQALDAFDEKTRYDTSLAQGLYNRDSRDIHVYFYENRDDLIFTIMHEMGHALSLSHNNDPDSIMREVTYLNEDRLITPSREDIMEVKNLCDSL